MSFSGAWSHWAFSWIVTTAFLTADDVWAADGRGHSSPTTAGEEQSEEQEAQHVDDSGRGVLSGLQMGTFRVDSASPGGRRLGVGLVLGWPTGLDVQWMVRPTVAVRLGAGALTGLSWTKGALSWRADGLWFPQTVARAPSFRLHTHVGLGGAAVVLPLPDQRTALPAALYFRGRTQLWTALRLPLGLHLALEDAPVDLVLDVVPQVLVFPGVTLGADVSLGARLWW